MDRTTLTRAQDNSMRKKEKTMNHSNGTALITGASGVIARFGRDPRHRASLLQHDLVHVQPVGPRGNPKHVANRGTASIS
jgi:hypothetical protein